MVYVVLREVSKKKKKRPGFCDLGGRFKTREIFWGDLRSKQNKGKYKRGAGGEVIEKFTSGLRRKGGGVAELRWWWWVS